MELSDFVSVIVALDDLERELYTEIVKDVGLPEPVVIDTITLKKLNITKPSQANRIAQLVSKIVRDRKSVVIGLKHYDIAFCYNDGKTTLVTFDAHLDDYEIPWDLPKFSNGSFLHYRHGRTYVLGTTTSSSNPRIKVLPPRKVGEVLEADIPNQIFLSLDIDVFDPTITRTHSYDNIFPFEKFRKLLGAKVHLSLEDVIDVSTKLIRGRNLMGVNIAEYDPQREQPPYKTAELLKQYLRAVLRE